jgi:hypothetical protein
MNNILTVRQGEAFYELKNILKTYRNHEKLYVFKTPVLKKHANLEINRELSNIHQQQGHKILPTEERDTMNQLRSTRRSRTKITDIIEMNDFAWFGTLTTSPKKVDRYNDSLVKRRVTRALANLQRFHRFEYLLIPERHKDGALHFHALLTGLPQQWLNDSGTVDRSNRKIYNLEPYKIGFSNFSKIENLEATAKYCAKYVTKSIDEQDKGKKRYWHSHGLRMPQKRENVDTKPYIEHPQLQIWDHEKYTGYQTPTVN